MIAATLSTILLFIPIYKTFIDLKIYLTFADLLGNVIEKFIESPYTSPCFFLNLFGGFISSAVSSLCSADSAAYGQYDVSTLAATPLAWVQKIANTYPEINWLAHDRVHATSLLKVSHKKRAVFRFNYVDLSMIEFNRSTSCLSWILEGTHASYNTFTQGHPEAAKLSWDSFKELHDETVYLIKHHPFPI